MDSWIWIVLLAGLFWVMHRGGMGCCGGHGHRHDSREDESGEGEHHHHPDENREVATGVRSEGR